MHIILYDNGTYKMQYGPVPSANTVYIIIHSVTKEVVSVHWALASALEEATLYDNVDVIEREVDL